MSPVIDPTTTLKTPRLDECARLVERIGVGVHELERAARSLEIPPLAGRDWYELLIRKLQPQLGRQMFLIVAVVGGTNIGKSVVFNHIAGEKLSSTSPMASGTKHPTAIIPRVLMDELELPELFPGFDIRPWSDAAAPLQEDPQHCLYFRVMDDTPENLIILDTPDVDSVAEVNWERAAHIRQSADVLVAILTQQKYNDAAVKEFFRQAVAEDKLVMIVFNQCLLPEDEEYWPLWVQTFCDETGIQPHSLYLVPNDRRAAESNQLPFYERPWPPSESAATDNNQGRSLLKDLSELRFGEIKIQALLGALRQLVDRQQGIPGWQHELEHRSRQFSEALEIMSSHRLVEIDRWPTLPNSILTEHIRAWWRDQREGWSATVHGFYNQLGKVVGYPVRAIRRHQAQQVASPLDAYREREWETVLQVLERSLQQLTWVREIGNELLSPRLDQILKGTSRAELIARVREEHQQIDFDREIRTMVDQQLANFREESPDFYRMFRRLDSAAAAARPAVSVMLFLTGAGPLGDALAPVVADSALQGILHIAGDAVGGTVVTAVGDKVITDSSATSSGYLEAKFRRLHSAFAQQRAAWMAEQLEKHLFGDLPQQLAGSSHVTQLPEFRLVRQLVNELHAQLGAAG